METGSKPWDPDRPFQRLNSPSFNLRGELNGDGHRAGTRRPSDFVVRSALDFLARREMLRLTPSWVLTEVAPDMPDDLAREKLGENEVYGRLVRSFQTWTDAPPLQWHRWYDWNFHLVPEPPFAWLRSRGNEESTDSVVNLTPGFFARVFGGDVSGPAQATVVGHCMECEWDTGVIGARMRPGPMFERDWAWPMAGDWVWLVGRSIYDGGHETNNLTRSELHPCKAVASVRREAFRFRKNGKFTPAMQFMFFTSHFGGYLDYADLKPQDGKDYEFIVDLPEAPEVGGPGSAAIGHTFQFPRNTIVLRPELLIDFDFERYSNARGRPPFTFGTPPPENLKPKVELVEPFDRAKPQVKITIPMETIVATGADFYGVLVSMGWRDLDGSQAAKVKKCTVMFENLFKAAINHDTFAEEWRLKTGVNGRWFQWQFEDMHNNTNHGLRTGHTGRLPVVLHLHEDDVLRFNAHGAELDLVDDVYFRNRTVRVHPLEIEFEKRGPSIPIVLDVPEGVVDVILGLPQGDLVEWKRHVDVRPPAGAPGTLGVVGIGAPGSHPEQRAVVRKLFSLMWTTFNDQNEPLGIIDAGLGPDTEVPFNPLKIKGLVGLGQKSFTLTGYFTWEKGDTAELLHRPHHGPANAAHAANPDFVDYKLTYSVIVENQA